MIWGSIEARCLRRRVLEVRLAGLPAALDGVTILHVSDVHAGHGPGLAMLERAVAWSEQLRPDLIALTGDLVTRARGIEPLQRSAAALAATARVGAFAVFGNHDHGDATDPFADGSSVRELDGFEMLPGAMASLELRGQRVSLVGVAADQFSNAGAISSYCAGSIDRRACACCSATSRPCSTASSPVPSSSCSPATCTRVRSACRGPAAASGSRTGTRATRAGLYQREGTLMHVSPGLGTTFLPFRILARPEATLLVLRAA